MIDISKVKRAFSKGDRKIISMMNSYGRSMEKSFWQAFEGKGKNLINCRKEEEGNTKGQFGYFHNFNVGTLYFLLKRLNIRSVCDLGSGAGILLGTMLNYDYDLRVGAIEIEESLVNYANKVFNFTTTKADIFNLTRDDLKYYQAIYFWEPVADYELCRKFVTHLENILSKDQIVIYRPAGAIHEFLDNSDKIKCLHGREYIHGYLLYTLK